MAVRKRDLKLFVCARSNLEAAQSLRFVMQRADEPVVCSIMQLCDYPPEQGRVLGRKLVSVKGPAADTLFP